MAANTGIQIQQDLLFYCSRLQQRALRDIDLVVIHCTELPDIPTARDYGERIHHEDSQTGNSGHFYIERNGDIQQWVPLERVAHHVRGYNDQSVGIELDNMGRYPEWFDSRRQEMSQPYTEKQLASLCQLLRQLQSQLPGLARISGHEVLDTGKVPASNDSSLRVYRKRDPGPLFPWPFVMQAVSLEFFDPGQH